jgi:homoserine O-succinyltransferase/O-acetyltransferase
LPHGHLDEHRRSDRAAPGPAARHEAISQAFLPPICAPPTHSLRTAAADLRIALVNNMPDAAVVATERQFSALLNASSSGLNVRLELYALSSVSRAYETRVAMAGRYADLGGLIAASPDVLIVTGAEPRAAELTDEPFWSELSTLVAWARSGGVVSAIYSCLAAHAAVRISDGVRRRPLPSKLTGVYAAEVVRAHELTAGLLGPMTPHSRYNGLEEQELESKGYVVLTRSPKGGVDTFVKEGAALEAFWQGHPEYEADTLAREARRDLQRFLTGGASTPPALPENYFAPEAHRQIERYLVDLSKRGDTAPAKLRVEALAPKHAVWAGASAALMRAFLVASLRRKQARTAMRAQPASADL